MSCDRVVFCDFVSNPKIAKLFLHDDFIFIIIYCWFLKIERKSKSSLLRSDYAQLSTVCVIFVCTGITVSWVLPLIFCCLPENMRSKEVYVTYWFGNVGYVGVFTVYAVMSFTVMLQTLNSTCFTLVVIVSMGCLKIRIQEQLLR